MNAEQAKKLFRYQHLPSHLQAISAPFYHLAQDLCQILPASAERTLAIRKLWDAKNLAVYAAVEDQGAAPPKS